MDKIIEISAFSKTYDGRRVLDFPGFKLEKGRICAVIGANGSGKSTLAKIIAGTLKADESTKPLGYTCRVGYMPQKSYAFHLKVLKNVRLGGGDKAQAMEMLNRLGIAHLAKKRANLLSGGETARMALSRILMGSYDLLILDEPCAAMDIQSTTAAEECIRDYARALSCAVLIVTHSLSEGTLAEHGSAQQVLAKPQNPKTRQFIEFYEL